MCTCTCKNLPTNYLPPHFSNVCDNSKTKRQSKNSIANRCYVCLKWHYVILEGNECVLQEWCHLELFWAQYPWILWGPPHGLLFRQTKTMFNSTIIFFYYFSECALSSRYDESLYSNSKCAKNCIRTISVSILYCWAKLVHAKLMNTQLNYNLQHFMMLYSILTKK